MIQTVIILGAGAPDGVGGALARKFSQGGDSGDGYHILVSGRTLSKVERVADQIVKAGGSAEALQVDVTSETDQDAIFARAKKKGPLAAVLFNAGNNAIIPFEELTLERLEHFWQIGFVGGFIAAKRAIPILKAQGEGSLFFTGASGSLRGKSHFAHFASTKAALRNLAQSLAREFGPHGVHVAHFIIDGVINGRRAKDGFQHYLDQLGEEGALSPEAIADAYWFVHSQPRSAWTHELDLRPFKEKW